MFKCLSPAPLGISASPNDLIEPVLSAGFKSLELDVTAFADQVTRVGMPGARRLIDSAKLTFGYFLLPFDLAAEELTFRAGLGALVGQAKLAAELGCQRCLTSIAPADDERPLHQNFVVHQQRIGTVAQLLGEHGIELGVGFCATPEPRAGRAFEFIRNFDTLKLLLGMVGDKNVGVVVDLYELWACGSSAAAIVETGSRVTAVFVADAPADVSPDDALQTGRLLPGETGTIDSVSALMSLMAAGFDGPVVPLPHPTCFAQLARGAACKLTGEKIDELWKAAGLVPARKPVLVRR